MPQLEPDPFYIDRKLISQTAKKLETTGMAVDKKIADYLEGYATGSRTRPPSLQLIGMIAAEARLIREVATDSVAVERRSASLGRAEFGPLRWGRQFLKQVLSELRDIICDPKHLPTDARKKSEFIVTALASVIVRKMGASSPVAIGLAVLILLMLGNAIRNAFCKMTDEEVLAALREKA